LRDDVAASIAAARRAVAEVASRAGRDPSSIHIVAVTKTFPPAAVAAALAGALAREAARVGRRVPVLIQVNVAAEAAKRGVLPEAVEDLARRILAEASLALDGLMTMPSAPAVPGDSRPFFRRLREVRDRAQDRLGVELPHLSMGMSSDFTVAVEEGATLLRLGRALFGARGLGASRPGSSTGGEGS